VPLPLLAPPVAQATAGHWPLAGPQIPQFGSQQCWVKALQVLGPQGMPPPLPTTLVPPEPPFVELEVPPIASLPPVEVPVRPPLAVAPAAFAPPKPLEPPVPTAFVPVQAGSDTSMKA